MFKHIYNPTLFNDNGFCYVWAPACISKAMENKIPLVLYERITQMKD